MPFFIATVWTASSAALAVDGNAALTRRVVRAAAETPQLFKAEIRDGYISDVDAVVEFGPIGLSKRQD